MEAALHMEAVPDRMGMDIPRLAQVLIHRRARGLSEGERRIHALVKLGAELWGQPLLEAKDRDEFEDRLDSSVVDPILYRVLDLLMQASPSDLAALSGESDGDGGAEHARDQGWVDQRLGLLFGELSGQRELVVRGDRLMQASMEASRQHRQRDQLDRAGAATTRGRRRPRTEGAVPASDDPLRRLFDPHVPPTVARLLFQARRVLPCMFAIAEILLGGGRPEAWLARAILETRVDSLYAGLRFWASIPGVTVSEEIVPRQERLDLEALVSHTKRFRRKLVHALDGVDSDDSEIVAPFGEPILD